MVFRPPIVEMMSSACTLGAATTMKRVGRNLSGKSSRNGNLMASFGVEILSTATTTLKTMIRRPRRCV